MPITPLTMPSSSTSFFPQALFREVAHGEAGRSLLQRAGDADRMQKALAALGGFQQTRCRQGGQFDDRGGDLDGVFHLALGEARMRAGGAADGDGGAVGEEM